MSVLVLRPVDPTPGLRGKPTPVGSASRPRVVGGTLLVTAVAASMTVGVRALPADGPIPFIAVLALGLVIVPLVGSVLEWFVHRFVYHLCATGLVRPRDPRRSSVERPFNGPWVRRLSTTTG